MSDQLALLRAVGATPDDDTPRLVYADFLDELGGSSNSARAEFIRLQVTASRMPWTNPRWDELNEKAARLEEQNRATWLAPFGEPFASVAEFHRGFVSVATLPAGSLDPAHPLPWQIEPDLSVCLAGSADAAVAALPVVAGVTGLRFNFEEVDEDVGDRIAAAIAAVPGLGSLRSLSLLGLRVTDDGARSLAGAQHLSQLRELGLWWNWMTATGWRVLVNAPLIDTVEELDLTSYVGMERDNLGIPYPGNKGAEAIATSPRLARKIRSLKLDNSHIRARGAAALSASPHLAGLEELSLASLDWKVDSLAALLEHDSFPRLKSLDLGQNRLGVDAMDELVESPLLARLEDLDLGHNRLDREAVISLLGAEDLSRLESLNLMANRFGDDGVEVLAACPKLTALRVLCLSHNRLTNRGAEFLLAATWLDQLDGLPLIDTKLPKVSRKRLKDRLGKVVTFRYSE